MLTADEHAETAEAILADVNENGGPVTYVQSRLLAAQVHATLSLRLAPVEEKPVTRRAAKKTTTKKTAPKKEKDA